MSYVKHGFTLTEGQKRSLRRALGNDSPVSLLFKHSALTGPDELFIPSQMARKVQKHLHKGIGMRVSLSKTAVKKNRQGGALPFLIPLLTSAITPAIQNTIGEITRPTSGTARLQRRLEALRGNGTSKAFVKGVELSQKPSVRKLVDDIDMDAPGAKRQVMSRLKEVGALKGKGLSGSGFLDDAWTGFKYGFTNPIGGIELVVRELSGKGQSGGCGDCQSGSGITFY